MGEARLYWLRRRFLRADNLARRLALDIYGRLMARRKVPDAHMRRLDRASRNRDRLDEELRAAERTALHETMQKPFTI